MSGAVFFAAECSPIGGQAVMEGVMMRNGDAYGLAVRQANGEICAQRFPWRRIAAFRRLDSPFLRGFPILIETMINGIGAMNRSAILSGEDRAGPSGGQGIFWSVFLAVLMALGLFVLAPHLLSLLMLHFGFGGDVEGLSFHLWDGLYKCAIFMAYIRLISLVPEIRRVYEYHGAEHKTIHAFESGDIINVPFASCMSRLHPRCGTTFLLFVICISIAAQAVLVPMFLAIWAPQGMIAKHALSIFYKLLLVAPISCVSYELIRFAARLPDGLFATMLQAPGLALQRLTTEEPDAGQLEVALVALAVALGPQEAYAIDVPPYRHGSPSGGDAPYEGRVASGCSG